MTQDDRLLYRRYAIEEQDNPDPTDQDIDDSIKESIEHYGCIGKSIRAMRQWYQSPNKCECPQCMSL